MTNFVTSVLRTLAQTVVGYLVTQLAARGLDVPEQVQTWAGGAIFAGGILLWTLIVRWLETRKGTGAVATAARRLARILMLGIGARPVYVPDGGAVQGESGPAGTTSVPFPGPAPKMAAATGRHGVDYAPGRADPVQIHLAPGGQQLGSQVVAEIKRYEQRDDTGWHGPAGTVL